jgi:hypothetical protein
MGNAQGAGRPAQTPMKKPLVLVVALGHFVCSYVLFFVSFGIAMKSFDGPHVPSASEGCGF